MADRVFRILKAPSPRAGFAETSGAEIHIFRKTFSVQFPAQLIVQTEHRVVKAVKIVLFRNAAQGFGKMGQGGVFSFPVNSGFHCEPLCSG